MKQTPEQDGRARGSHQPAADAIKAGASALVGGAHRAAAHSATPADRPLSPPPMRFDLGTLNAAQATSSARSLHATPRTAAPSARHLGAQPAWGTPLSETPEQNARESSAAPTLAAAVSRDPAGNDARAASARQAETLRDATARAEPAPVNVEIGRIEVRIAPPPAPASRPRAAPEGFERYWRLRNYLDRSG